MLSRILSRSSVQGPAAVNKSIIANFCKRAVLFDKKHGDWENLRAKIAAERNEAPPKLATMKKMLETTRQLDIFVSFRRGMFWIRTTNEYGSVRIMQGSCGNRKLSLASSRDPCGTLCRWSNLRSQRSRRKSKAGLLLKVVGEKSPREPQERVRNKVLI